MRRRPDKLDWQQPDWQQPDESRNSDLKAIRWMLAAIVIVIGLFLSGVVGCRVTITPQQQSADSIHIKTIEGSP
jgi:hypothetical protein